MKANDCLNPDPLRLDERVALVTGAARGLGAAHAIQLASRGARTVLVDVLDSAAVASEIERLGGQAIQLQLDLASAEGCIAAVTRAVESYGRLDIVVNNAGILRDRMSFNISPTDWDLVLAVNLTATFHVSAAAARVWRSAGGPRRERVIVNTSSESGLFGNAGQANYAAAKAGVAALTVTMATELERQGIRVNAIAPRARTAMSFSAFGELTRDDDFDPFAADHAAHVVAWLVSDAARDVTGQVLVVHGTGIEVMQPWRPRRAMTRRGHWTDEELLGLHGQLFPSGESRHIAAPVGALFTAESD